jgi:pre-mRNA-splicing factor ATP-dependent RNA helicase DHX16
MNDEQLRKARLESRSNYLQTKSHVQEKAGAVVLRETMKDIELGIIPTTLLEMETIQRRADEIEVAAELLKASDTRAAMARGESVLKPDGNFVGAFGDDAEDGSPLSRQLRRGSANADEVLQILPDMASVQARIAAGDVVLAKTEDDIAAERAAAVSVLSSAIQTQRKTLPVFKVRDEFVATVKKHQVVVVIGETGSGKTTQLLQYLFEEGFGQDEAKLICTQPRRIAATSVAQRVAQEMGVRCGGLVGYKVRFDDKTSDVTQIMFMTDGIMLKEITGNHNLAGVSVLMVDEAHERTIASDILLGLLRDVIRENKKIRVVVASATIEADKFCKFFGAPKFEIKGRTFRVSVSYSMESIPDMVMAAATTAMMVHEEKPLPGDILVFLPGQEEIETCAQLLRDASQEKGSSIRELMILPIYSTLPPEEQNKIYSPTPTGSRKVVIATNIAETSITIDGIVYVIDSGLCKQKFFNPETLMEQLSVVPTSQASAEQRRGRAGRTRPGECIRLFTKYSFLNELPKETVPEILRSTLSTVVLNLKCLGIDDLLNFDFLDAPSEEALERSLDHLYLLGAITEAGKASKVGLQMSEFPLDPALARCMVKAKLLGCPRAMAIAASMLSLENNLFRAVRATDERKRVESARDKVFGASVGDVHGYVRLFQQWLEFGNRGEEFCKSHFINSKSVRRACDIFNQLLKTYEKLGVDTASGAGEASQEALTKSLLAGFFPNVAHVGFDGVSYQIIRPFGKPSSRITVQPPPLQIHPSSFLARAGGQTAGGGEGVLARRPELVLFILLRQTSKPFMQHVTVLADPQTVLDVAPRGYFSKEDLSLSMGRKR